MGSDPRSDPILEFRRALVRRFPFEVFYEPAQDCITIYSVFRGSQDPQKWRARLGPRPDGRLLTVEKGPDTGTSAAAGLGNLYNPFLGTLSDTF